MAFPKKSRKGLAIAAMDEAPAAAGPSIIKHLASCNKTTRDKALKLLKTWLPNQPQVSADEMKLIWKGLFYCVWHADKFSVQSELIDRLSSLLLTLDLPLSIHYFSIFLLTMRREWSGIDALRLDKFYLLIRKFMFNFFRLLKKNSWDFELTNRLVGVLDERTFSADDKCQGNGVNYHIASVFLDEIRLFLPLRLETLDLFFKLFVSVMGKSPNKVLLGKIKSNIFDVLLKMGYGLLEVRKSGSDIDSGDEVVLYGTIAFVMGFSNKFYELGSSPDCLQGNRKILFGLHECFLKLEKDLASSGIKVSIPEIKVDDEEDEVPSLIPISTEGELGSFVVVSGSLEIVNVAERDGSAINRSKKREKAKPLEVVKEVDGSAVRHSKKRENVKPSEVVEDVDGSAIRHSKKREKAKKCSDGCCKKTKKSDTKVTPALVIENGSGIEEKFNFPVANGENDASDGNLMNFNESVISNLQMQFEKIAAEAGLENDSRIECESPKIAAKNAVSKKRKRAKSMDVKESRKVNGDAGIDGPAKSGEKSAKKVRFSMKNNLVWKPQTPLPPQSLRIPPSVTPRGSALKQGIPPGPVREMQTVTKKVKRVSYVKKGRKGIKGISPATKRLKKIKFVSM